MLKPPFIATFTGHRSSDSPGRSPQELEATRSQIKNALQEFQTKAEALGCDLHLYTSLAEGADTIACEVAIELDLSLHVALPLPIDEFRKDYADRMEAWPRAEAILDHLRSEKNASTLRVTPCSHQRPDCYAEVNSRMLSVADALIAVSTSDPAKGIGGSSDLKNQAYNAGLPSIIINPATGDVATHHQDQILPKNDPSLEICRSLLADAQDKTPSEVLDSLDQKAGAMSSRTRQNRRLTIFLQGLASLLGALGISYSLSTSSPSALLIFSLSLLALLAIIAVESIARIQRSQGHAESWLQCRYAAELLRPLPLTRSWIDPLHPLVDHHAPQWRRFLQASSLALPASPNPADLAQAKELYLKDRLLPQMSHFEEKAGVSTPKISKTDQLSRAFSVGALIAITLATLEKACRLNTGSNFGLSRFGLPPSSTLIFILAFLPIALPLIAGFFNALRHSSDDTRRSIRYQQLSKLLQKSHTAITQSQTKHEFLTQLTRVEELLLDELNEFLIFRQVKMNR